MLDASESKSHPSIQEESGHMNAVRAVSTLPPNITSIFPEESSTIGNAKESPEWAHWKGALERLINGENNNGVWVQVERPESKTVQLLTLSASVRSERMTK